MKIKFLIILLVIVCLSTMNVFSASQCTSFSSIVINTPSNLELLKGSNFLTNITTTHVGNSVTIDLTLNYYDTSTNDLILSQYQRRLSLPTGNNDYIFNSSLTTGNYYLNVSGVCLGVVQQFQKSSTIMIDVLQPPIISSVPLVCTTETECDMVGTINDENATIQVTINDITSTATNNLDGTWSLEIDTNYFPLGDDLYNVTLNASDSNNGMETINVSIDGLEVNIYEKNITIDELSTYDTSPMITGSVTSPRLIRNKALDINNDEYPITLLENGTWYLSQGVINPPLSVGVYEVSVTIFDGYRGATNSTYITILEIPPPICSNFSITHYYNNENLSLRGILICTGRTESINPSYTFSDTTSQVVIVDGLIYDLNQSSTQSDGYYDLNFDVSNDTESFFNNDTWIIIDTLKPTLIIDGDTGIINRKNIIINISSDDLNYANTTFYLYNSNDELVYTFTSTEKTFQIDYNISVNGDYHYNAISYDLAENNNVLNYNNITIDYQVIIPPTPNKLKNSVSELPNIANGITGMITNMIFGGIAQTILLIGVIGMVVLVILGASALISQVRPPKY